MDSKAFTSTFLKLRDRLKAISQVYLADNDDVNDALQDMFIRLWGNSDKYENEKQAAGAMVTTIKNISIDNLRRTAAHPKTDIDNLQDVQNDDNDIKETIDDIDCIIDSELTPQQKQILYQRDRDGWDYDEIAKFHGISETNVRVILSRARKKVRDIYNKNYETH